MRIWIDADACPLVVKQILFRAAERKKIKTMVIANQAMAIPRSPYIQSVQVSAGIDMADNYIVQNMQAKDLVITADIPLADQVITKGGVALNPRGELYTVDNIKTRLMIRNFNDELRGTGVHTGGPAPLSKREIEIFANNLDKFLMRL